MICMPSSAKHDIGRCLSLLWILGFGKHGNHSSEWEDWISIHIIQSLFMLSMSRLNYLCCQGWIVVEKSLNNRWSLNPRPHIIFWRQNYIVYHWQFSKWCYLIFAFRNTLWALKKNRRGKKPWPQKISRGCLFFQALKPLWKVKMSRLCSLILHILA